MTQLGLGTATFVAGYGFVPNTPTLDAAAGLLRDAFVAGIRYVDTAAGYGDAEAVVGRVARDIAEHGVRVCTKVSGTAAMSHRLVAEVRSSLTRLRLDAVDTLLLHSVDATVLTDPALGAELDDVRARGLALRTGASTYGVANARAVLAQPWCGALQIEHSILNPSVLSALIAKPRCVEIVARSVLCKGLLTSRRQHGGEIASGLAPTLDALERVAADWGWPMAEVAIRFALDTRGVDVVVVGISTDSELRTALSAAARPPLETEARAVLAGFNRSELDAVHPERWNVAETHGA